jgi:hypothetical protein
MDHLFITIGNGTAWSNGVLVHMTDTGYLPEDDPNLMDISLAEKYSESNVVRTKFQGDNTDLGNLVGIDEDIIKLIPTFGDNEFYTGNDHYPEVLRQHAKVYICDFGRVFWIPRNPDIGFLGLAMLLIQNLRNNPEIMDTIHSSKPYELLDIALSILFRAVDSIEDGKVLLLEFFESVVNEREEIFKINPYHTKKIEDEG